MATLQSYLTATQRLLHDASFKYWNQQTLTDAINGACMRVVGDSQCNRQLQIIYLSQGLEQYNCGGVTGAIVNVGGSGYSANTICTFSAPPSGGTTATGTVSLSGGTVSQIVVTNTGSGYLTAPTCTITDTGGGVNANVTPTILNPNMLDCLSTTVLWGSQRIVLDNASFTSFQTTYRAFTPFNQRPCAIAKYGQNGWFIGPIPDQFYVSEWDSIIIPSTLVNLLDISVIQYPYSECVPYYAAHTAKFQEQSYDDAARFLQLYTQKMMYSRRSIQMRTIPNAYGG